MEEIRIIITDNVGNVKSDDNQYSSYTFPADYEALTSAFSVKLVNVDFEVVKGDLIQFWINQAREFDGIIQRVEKSTSKSSRDVTLSGKDRTSILVENYCNNFKDFNNKTPIQIIDTLIAQTNFYVKPKGTASEISDSTGFSSESDIEDRNETVLNDVNNSETINARTQETTYDEDFTALGDHKNYKINIGDLVFSKINQLVKSYGFEILYDNTGELYIGDLNKKRYDDEIVYETVFKKDGTGNVLTARMVDDISGRYSSIMVSCQYEGFSGEQKNSFATATDSTLPAIKYMAISINDSKASPEKMAIQTREDQRIEGFSLTHTVSGHIAENGKTWKINRLVNVVDEINDIRRHLVLYSRIFTYSLTEGRKTTLRMSHERINELEI